MSNADAHRDFVNGTGAGAFQHIDDPAQELWDRFGVTQQRTYVYIDDAGNVTQTGYGNLRNDVLDLIAQ